VDAIIALKTRRSVRSFETRPVAREIIEDIIDCGRLAASAINIQPWEFVVVTEPRLKRQIAETTDHGRFLAEAPVCVVVLSRDTKYFLEDGSAATENILVAARAHGLGSCWIAGDKKSYAADICRLVGAPDGYRLVSLIAIGYSQAEGTKDKRPLSSVLHWERY